MNHYTFLGYYLEEKNEVTFYSVVDNYLNLQQFCLPLIEVEDLCYKYQLPYEKSMTMKTDLVTFDQIKREINYIFHRISEDYASYQYFGAIVLIELDRNIISGFKILNQEMKIFHKIKKIKFGKDENDTTSLNDNIKKTQTSKLNKFINKLTYFNLPRNKNLYVQLYNNITEEDSLFKCIELIDDLSKNENEIDIILKNSIQNPQQEIINPNLIYTHNLLSCLIPLDTKAQQDNSGNYSISDYQLKNSLKCSTFDNNPDSPEILVNNKITTFKESVIITRKKHHQLNIKKEEIKTAKTNFERQKDNTCQFVYNNITGQTYDHTKSLPLSIRDSEIQNKDDLWLSVYEYYGKCTDPTQDTFSYMLNKEYQIVSDQSDQYLNTAIDNFNKINNDSSINNIFNTAQSTIQNIQSTVSGIKDSVAGYIIDYSDMIENYGKLGFKGAYAVLTGIDVIIATLLIISE